MKRTIFLATVVALGTFAFADPTTQPSTQPSAAINKFCPMTQEEVNPKVTTVYNGKTVAFCCKDCIAEFKKDPDKHMKDIEAEAAKEAKEKK